MKAAANNIVAEVRKRQAHDEQELEYLQAQRLDPALFKGQQRAVQARHRRQGGGGGGGGEYPPLLAKVLREVPSECVAMLNTLEAAGYIEQQVGVASGGDADGQDPLHAVFLNQSVFLRSEQWASQHPLFELMPQLVTFLGGTAIDALTAVDNDGKCDDLGQFVAEAVHLKTAVPPSLRCTTTSRRR
jgi:hypothetical protein